MEKSKVIPQLVLGFLLGMVVLHLAWYVPGAFLVFSLLTSVLGIWMILTS